MMIFYENPQSLKDHKTRLRTEYLNMIGPQGRAQIRQKGGSNDKFFLYAMSEENDR